MERVELIRQLLRESMQMGAAAFAYQHRRRACVPEEALYLREAHFLLAMDPETPLSMGEMAGRLEITRGAATQIAQRLEKKGYLRREKSPADRRVSRVLLTGKGDAARRAHLAYDRARYETISAELSDFSDGELERLSALQRRVAALLAEEEEPSTR